MGKSLKYQRVGWAERSEAQQVRRAIPTLGFASLSTSLQIGDLQRSVSNRPTIIISHSLRPWKLGSDSNFRS
jgi:hypothetical protein